MEELNKNHIGEILPLALVQLSSRVERTNLTAACSVLHRLFKILIIINLLVTEASCLSDDALRDISLTNFGCENVGEHGLVTNPYTPDCGCGSYAVRIFKAHLVSGLRNVTVPTHKGKSIVYECKTCRICSGVKVEQVCRPKENTQCSRECVIPCYDYNRMMKRCMPSSRCSQSPTTQQPPSTSLETTTKVQAQVDQPITDRYVDQPIDSSNPHSTAIHHPRDGANLHAWLIVAAVVIAFAIVAVIIMILFALRNHFSIQRHTLCTSATSTQSSREKITDGEQV
ncbi:uncharacterized protein [Apostichopus japonicus]|uniref:uncharacterized protein isoform X2 n=1 Tax=Stichopus japonicus TaxID=307972 RepID=UPI003AB4AE6C